MQAAFERKTEEVNEISGKVYTLINKFAINHIQMSTGWFVSQTSCSD